MLIPVTFLYITMLLMFLMRSEGRDDHLVVLGGGFLFFKGMQL